MSDDEDGSGLGGILYYEMGRHAGERSARSRQNVEEFRDRQAGLIKVNESDWNILVTNRDALYQHVLSANDEIDNGNAIIRQMSSEMDQLREQVNFHRQQAETAHHRWLEDSQRDERSNSYLRGLNLCLQILLKAAEEGRAGLPEFHELKAIVEQMREAWETSRIQLYSSDRLGPHIGSLIRILDPTWRP